MSEQPKKYKTLIGDILVGKDTLVKHGVRSCIERNVKFINASNRDLWICDSNGAYTRLKSNIDFHHRNQLIVTHYHANFNHDTELIEGMESEVHNKMRTAYLENGGDAYWEETVEIDSIELHPQGVYLPYSDVIVTLDYQIAKHGHHFHCEQKIHNDYVRAVEDIDYDKMINVNIRLVDNSGIFPTIYTVFNGTVQKLEAIQSPVLQDGLYVTGLMEFDAEGQRSIRKDIHYSFDDLKAGKAPIKLFDTIRAAIAERDDVTYKDKVLIDKEKARQNELLINELQNQRQQRELDVKKLEADVKEKAALLIEQKAVLEKEILQMKMDRDRQEMRLQMELDTMRYHQETRTSNQKEGIELLKTIGSLAAAGMVLWKIFA